MRMVMIKNRSYGRTHDSKAVLVTVSALENFCMGTA